MSQIGLSIDVSIETSRSVKANSPIQNPVNFLSRKRPVSKVSHEDSRISHERYEDAVIKIILKDGSFLEAWRQGEEKFRIERVSVGKNATESATILMTRLVKELDARGLGCEIDPLLIRGAFVKDVSKFLRKFGFEKGERDVFSRVVPLVDQS